MIWLDPQEKDVKCMDMNANGKIRMNVEDEDDRLSSLPDELIHKILSFTNLRHVIGLSVLSTRWKFIWTTIPYLNFGKYHTSSGHFSQFVSNILLQRNNQIQVSSLNLGHCGRSNHESVDKILNYAFSHDLQQLTVTWYDPHNKFPFSLFGSQFLKHLALIGTQSIVPPTWDLPSLTTLNLDVITLSYKNTEKDIGLFYKCTKLRNLTLNRFEVEGTNVLNIYHPRLENLALEDPKFCWMKRCEYVNVVAPQLKNLTLTNCDGKHMISARGLTSLVMKGDRPLKLCMQDFPFLEKVDLGPFSQQLPPITVSMLQQLHNVKFLTLDWEFLEHVSSFTSLYPQLPSRFTDLKILNLKPSRQARVYMEVPTHEKVTTSIETQNSELFTMVSCEEMRVMRNIISAKSDIGYIRLSLSLAKISHERANAPMENPKVEIKKQWTTQSTFEMQWQFKEMMAQIKQAKIEGLMTKWHFAEMMTQIKEGNIEGFMIDEYTTDACTKACDVILSLQCVKGLLTEWPASKGALMQEIFLSLCEEAAFVITKLIVSKLKS